MTLLFPSDYYFEQYKTKHNALFHYLRDAIVAGVYLAHEKLPPTRELAKQFNVSRGTVNNAYDMLMSQGYIYSIIGSGTFVSSHVTFNSSTDLTFNNPRFSAWGQRLLINESLSKYKKQKINTSNSLSHTTFKPISFFINQVNLTDFPLSEWNKVMYEHTRQQYDVESISTISAAGDLKLRQLIAQHLHVHRGFNCDSSQIVIVNGSLQALALIAHLFIDEGDAVAFENPHYSGMRTSVETLGGIIDTYPVDEEGIMFIPQKDNYKLMYLTPNRQFPTGAVLSMKRRRELLDWAKEHDCFIIEDDYDSEFSFSNRAIEPLKALDAADQVIYVGTFSRTMMQHIRLGYAVLPKRLVEPFIAAKMLFERLPSAIVQQQALASFMERGYYHRHLRRLRRIYRERALFFQQQLLSKLPHLFIVHPLNAGLHVFVEWIAEPEMFEPFLHRCKELNIKIASADYMYYHSPKHTICMGFAHLTLLQIEEGVSRLVLAYNTIVSSSSQ